MMNVNGFYVKGLGQKKKLDVSNSFQGVLYTEEDWGHVILFFVPSLRSEF